MHTCKHCHQPFKTRRLYEGHLDERKKCPVRGPAFEAAQAAALAAKQKEKEDAPPTADE